MREAARRLGRDVKGVHRDVHMLLNVGILQKTDKGQIEFPFEAVHVDFMLKAAWYYWATNRIQADTKSRRDFVPIWNANKKFAKQIAGQWGESKLDTPFTPFTRVELHQGVMDSPDIDLDYFLTHNYNPTRNQTSLKPTVKEYDYGISTG